MAMMKCGDLRLPIGAALLQIAFIVLFGVFVRYDEQLGLPNTDGDNVTDETPLKSTLVLNHMNQFYAGMRQQKLV